ncbi:MAG: D-alanine--D-alanine ligase A, partial [Firmicutes bacterium]|nr:D-alanine--D-alanine ligase A [Bacillota bacterium]
MNKKKIAIVFGGKSSEHDVSLMSAASVIRAINKERYELLYIGITRDGQWRRLVLPEGKTASFAADVLDNGTWEAYTETFNMSYIKKVADFALPIIHGPNCEDGKLQGFFETVGIPYGGCGVLASALAMDKLAAKDVFRTVGFPICKHRALFKYKYEEDRERAENHVATELGYPCFVKPA